MSWDETAYWSGDLDGDGALEVLIGAVDEPGLTCLDGKGKVRWRYVINSSIRDAKLAYDPPWIVNSFVVHKNQVVVITRHHSHYPAQVAVLDANGVRLREYWHTGHLAPLAIGKYKGKDAIFAGGINNARRAATLVVLDPESLQGWGAEEGNLSFQGMKNGNELARFVFGRSSIDFKMPYNAVNRVITSEQGVMVDVAESLIPNDSYAIAYHFDQELNVEAIAFSDHFAMKFRETLPSRSLDEERAKLKVTRIK